MDGATQNGPTSLDDLLQPVRRIFAQLMHATDLPSGDVDGVFRQLTESATEALDVERASVWRLRDEGQGLECVRLFQRSTHEHSSGLVLSAAATPRYFEALSSERSIAAHDAQSDPRTSEFTEGYLRPLGITSMLDAPVFVDGKLFGVVCHEHVGDARRWSPWEELVAGTFADLTALVVSAAARAEQQRALDVYRLRLEQLVDERTRQLGQSEERFHALFDAAPVGLILSRLSDETVLAANPYAAALFGIATSEVSGQHATDYWVDGKDRERLVRMVRESGTVDSFVARLRARDGRDFWANVAVRLVSIGGDRALLFGVRDVTAERESEEQLRLLATIDELTGALNRRRLFEVVEEEVARTARYDRPLSFAMLDLDHFKGINDRFGHVFGDEVLRAVAQTVRTNLRRQDHLGRYGGEELAIVLPETPLDAARVVVERARTCVAELELRCDGERVPITFSAGVVAHRADEPVRVLLQRADAALYEAKRTGRNRVVSEPPR